MQGLHTVFLLSLFLCSSIGYAIDEGSVYTDIGSGPDKWASIWALKKYADKNVIILADASQIDTETFTVFDVPGYPLSRDGSSTTLSKLVQHFQLNDSGVTAINKIIHEIEVDAWKTSVSDEALIVEQGFRSMQLRYGREKVTQTCYLQFFDSVLARIEADSLIATVPSDLIPPETCMVEKLVNTSAVADLGAVPTLDLDAMLVQRGNEEVVFIDTRETWEYEEGHIPGAVNLKLREIDLESVADLRKAGTVIAYCVKDFRGYEAARKMRSMGINAAIMTPYGMRGWVGAGLPVAGARGLSESQALVALNELTETRTVGSD